VIKRTLRGYSSRGSSDTQFPLLETIDLKRTGSELPYSVDRR